MLNAQRFEQVRRYKGIRKGWLAEKLGMLPPVFSRRLHGPLRFSKEHVTKMSKWLGVDVSELWLEKERRRGRH